MDQWVGDSAAKGGQQDKQDGKNHTGRQEGIPLLYTKSYSYTTLLDLGFLLKKI